MYKEVFFLGKSSFAIGVLSDTLYSTGLRSAVIVSNMPDEENDSLNYNFRIEGIRYSEISHKDFKPSKEDVYVVASIGKGRRYIVEFFMKTFNLALPSFIKTIHPSSVVCKEVSMGYGFHISPLSVVAPFVSCGDFVVINRNSSIGHHCVLEDFVTINPGVNVAGCCHIGKNVLIGAGATIIDGIKIGANSIIGAGSLVTKDVPEGVVVYGSPAKMIRENF